MQLIHLAPDSTTLNSPAFTVGGGAADVDDALRDQSVTNWIQSDNTPEKIARVTLEDYTPASNERIAYVLCRGRCYSNSSSVLELILRDGTTNLSNMFFWGVPGPSPGIILQGLKQRSEPVSGTEWDATTLNALVMEIQSNSLGLLRTTWADLEVALQTQPIVSFIAPAASPVATSFRVLWSLSGGDTPSKYQVKVFTRAVAEGGGFDPATSTTIYNSGINNWPGSGYHDIPAGILTAGTEYYVYVKSSVIFLGPISGEDWYSDWTGKYFKTVSLPVANPTTPNGAIASAQPDLVYAYSDADSKVESYTTLRIYERPGGSWTGFDPETTTQVPLLDWDVSSSPFVLSAVVPPIILQNGGVYRFYAQAVATSGAETYVGAWDFNDFNVVLDPPPAPDLTITPDVVNARVQATIGKHANKLTANQSSVETDTTGFVVDTNATIARSTANFDHGVASLELTRGGAASLMSAGTSTGLNGAPVEVGVQYTARAKFKTAVTARTCVVKIRWYDAAGATLSTSTGSGITDGTGGFTEATVTATAPASAAFASVIFEVQGALAAAEKHYVDRISLAAGTTVTAPWSLGFGSTIAYTLERSDDGLVWYAVRGAAAILMPTQSVVVYDHEAPTNQVVQYRASLTGIAGVASVASAYTSASTTLVGTRVWIKDPFDTTKNRHVLTQDGWWARRRRRRRAFYEPLGREDAVAFRGKGKGETFTGTFLALSDAQADAIEALLDTDGPLLVQSPRKQWYVELDGDYDIQQSLWDELHGRTVHAQIYSAPFHEVGRP